MGKNVSLACFIAGAVFAICAATYSVYTGRIADEWQAIAGMAAVISQLAFTVNISKIIQTVKGVDVVKTVSIAADGETTAALERLKDELLEKSDSIAAKSKIEEPAMGEK